MARKKLSAIAIPTLAAGTYADQIMPGLLFIVGKSRKTWAYRYRSGGKRPKLRLGYYPQLSLGDARTAARKAAERLDSGVTPAAPAPHPRSPDTLTLGGMIDRYEKLRTKEGGRVKSLPEAMASLRRNLKPWLSLPADQFSKADLRDARDKTAESRGLIAANRLIAYIGPMLRWAAAEDLIAANFASAVRRAPESKRTRKLSDKEIVAIWRACDDLGTSEAAKNFGKLVKFLLVTAQRRDEGASLRHGDIIGGRWKQTRNKADRPHTLALPPLALSLIGQGTAPQEFCFGGRSGKLSGYSKLKAALDKASGVTGWTLHDLRRTAASRMQALGVPNHVISGGILNHSLGGAAAHDLQDSLEAQKAEALETWALALAKIVRPMTLVAS